MYTHVNNSFTIIIKLGMVENKSVGRVRSVKKLMLRKQLYLMRDWRKL